MKSATAALLRLVSKQAAGAGARRHRADCGADAALEELGATFAVVHRVALVVVTVDELVCLHHQVLLRLRVVMQWHVVHLVALAIFACAVWHKAVDTAGARLAPLTNLIGAL